MGGWPWNPFIWDQCYGSVKSEDVCSGSWWCSVQMEWCQLFFSTEWIYGGISWMKASLHVSHTTNNAAKNHWMLLSYDIGVLTKLFKKKKSMTKFKISCGYFYVWTFAQCRCRAARNQTCENKDLMMSLVTHAQPLFLVFLSGSAHPGDPLPCGGQEFSSRLHGPHYSAHSHRGWYFQPFHPRGGG